MVDVLALYLKLKWSGITTNRLSLCSCKIIRVSFRAPCPWLWVPYYLIVWRDLVTGSIGWAPSNVDWASRLATSRSPFACALDYVLGGSRYARSPPSAPSVHRSFACNCIISGDHYINFCFSICCVSFSSLGSDEPSSYITNPSNAFSLRSSSIYVIATINLIL